MTESSKEADPTSKTCATGIFLVGFFKRSNPLDFLERRIDSSKPLDSLFSYSCLPRMCAANHITKTAIFKCLAVIFSLKEAVFVLQDSHRGLHSFKMVNCKNSYCSLWWLIDYQRVFVSPYIRLKIILDEYKIHDIL